eukprot:3422359-Lingulodinium_polyedra.AAC.1
MAAFCHLRNSFNGSSDDLGRVEPSAGFCLAPVEVRQLALLRVVVQALLLVVLLRAEDAIPADRHRAP